MSFCYSCLKIVIRQRLHQLELGEVNRLFTDASCLQSFKDEL